MIHILFFNLFIIQYYNVIGSSESHSFQKILISILRAIVYIYSSPYACFKGVSTAVGKPIVLGDYKWRSEIFQESLDEIISHLPLFILQSISSNLTNDSSLFSFSPINTSRSPSPSNNSTTGLLSSSSPFSSSKHGSGQGMFSPSRIKKTTPTETIEKILQHIFYVIESLCKFDCGMLSC